HSGRSRPDCGPPSRPSRTWRRLSRRRPHPTIPSRVLSGESRSRFSRRTGRTCRSAPPAPPSPCSPDAPRLRSRPRRFGRRRTRPTPTVRSAIRCACAPTGFGTAPPASRVVANVAEGYTPTTDQVRQAWRLYRLSDFFGKANYGRGTDALNAEFDHWLAEVRREARIEALRQARGWIERLYRAGLVNRAD